MRSALPLLAAATLAVVPARGAARSRPGAVATEHAFAADAGGEMLRAGGNAVDAAIATAAAVCVVHASSCGMGGGGVALVHEAGGRTQALDYRETAPAAATPDRFHVAGRPEPALLRTGGLAVGVPGDVAGLVALHRRFGRLPFAQVLAPAIALARSGFRLREAPHLRREIERTVALLAADPGLRATFLTRDGEAPGDDFRVVQSDLAHTFEAVARDGGRGFYRGSLARAIAAAVQARGGVLTVEDLARYRPVWRVPLRRRFHGDQIVTFPPPGSGGVLLEILGLLAHDDLAALGADTSTFWHLLASAMAQGFADRARWYGDPAFTPVPVSDLLAPIRLATLRAGMSAVRTATPRVALTADSGTAHVSVVDEDGNAAAMTTTINTAFGAGITVPGAGIILNNEMDDFAVAANVPNVYGLTGGAANAVGPGKRPQSSMSPTIVLAGRRPALVVGGSGGPTIVTATVQVLLGMSVFGRSVRAAVEAPRIHDQGAPLPLAVEPGVDPMARDALVRLGHVVRELPAIGAAAATGLGPDGAPAAAGDTRKDGGAVIVQ